MSKRIKDRRLNVMEYRLDNPVWQFIDLNNIAHQLDATITVY